MILETDRLIADWLAGTTDATKGVNALIATTPRDSGDSAPANLATVTDETRDENVARGQLPASLPALAVSIDAIQELDGQVAQVTRDGHVKVRIRVGLSNATTSDGIRDLSYYLRTAMRSLRQLFDASATSANRTRNNIYLESCLDMAEAIVWTKDQADSATITGYILATLQLRDNLP